MSDLYTNVVLRISDVEAVTLLSNAGVASGTSVVPVRKDKIFVPNDDMPMTHLAEIFAVYINVKLSGSSLTTEEYEAIPAHIRQYFQDL